MWFLRSATILEFRVDHSFYGDGACCDFTLEPSPDAKARLAGLRLLSKSQGDRLWIIAELNESGQPLSPLTGDETLSFLLCLKNSAILPYTELDALQAQPAPLFTDAGVTAADSMTLRLTSQSFGGRIPGVFAMVEASISDALIKERIAANTPRKLLIPFTAGSAKWCYYLVTDRTDPIESFRIIASSSETQSSPVVFSDAGRADLSQQPDATDAVACDLQSRYAGRRLIRFLSDQPVVCRSEPVKNLELWVGESTQLVSPLPNPTPQQSALLAAASSDPAAPAPVYHETLGLVPT